MSRSHHKGGQPTQRMLRVGELIRQAVSDLLTRGYVHDPALEGQVITVAKVTMSPDLKRATIFVLPMSGQDKGRQYNDTIVKALGKHTKTFRAEIAGLVNLKFAPEVRFKFDDSFEKSAAIDALLNSPKVIRDIAGQSDPDSHPNEPNT